MESFHKKSYIIKTINCFGAKTSTILTDPTEMVLNTLQIQKMYYIINPTKGQTLFILVAYLSRGFEIAHLTWSGIIWKFLRDLPWLHFWLWPKAEVISIVHTDLWVNNYLVRRAIMCSFYKHLECESNKTLKKHCFHYLNFPEAYFELCQGTMKELYFFWRKLHHRSVAELEIHL